MTLKGHWLYVCSSAFCIWLCFDHVLSYLCFKTLTSISGCACVRVRLHSLTLTGPWLFDCRAPDFNPKWSLTPSVFFFFFSHYLFSPLSSATKYQQERVCVGVSRIILRPLLHCPGVCSAPEQRFGSTGVLIFKNIFWVFNLFFRAKTILTISFMIKHSS